MHGRDIEIPAGATYAAYPAYAALPDGARRGVVVLFELLGRQPEIDRVVERFAEAGYAAVEPDLFARRGRLGCIRDIVHAVQTGEGVGVDRVNGARDWLCSAAKLERSQVVVIGFCLGGGFALAVGGGGYGAVSTNYGDLPPDAVLAKLPPTIGCYGGRDRVFGRKGEELSARLVKLGVPVETHTFPEAGHSLLTDGHHPFFYALAWPTMRIEWNAAVAEEAWRRIFDFFDRHLAPGDRRA